MSGHQDSPGEPNYHSRAQTLADEDPAEVLEHKGGGAAVLEVTTAQEAGASSVPPGLFSPDCLPTSIEHRFESFSKVR